LEAAKERLKADREQVTALYYRDRHFRAICDDYYLSLEHLKKFGRESLEDFKNIKDYEELVRELERELNNYINMTKIPPHGSFGKVSVI
jgi:hypothetical protein